MNKIKLSDINIYDIGNEIGLCGAVFSGKGKVFLVPFPEQKPEDLECEKEVLVMNSQEWEVFLRQSDIQEVLAPNKAILRKSQRMIDSHLQWICWRRDGFICQYCGQAKPLTIDHIICWEDGGATNEENLVSCCKQCNKTRGNMEYNEWIVSPAYIKLSKNLSVTIKAKNEERVKKLSYLKSLTVKTMRSR